VRIIFTKVIVSVVFILLFAGWGAVGHKIINTNITVCFPSSMDFPLSTWNSFLIAHASDPDNRKGSDPTESPRHFIDIDAYPEFVANGYINQSYNANVTLHTSAWVIAQGTLPWAIVLWEDSLKRAFQQGNWSLAMQLSADLGHYVGDGHQPLHCTQNYDGALTGQSGVHSRYETKLVEAYQTSIVYTNDKASYVSNISNYVFNFIYLTNKYVDSVLSGDKVATAYAGKNSGTTYLAKYWEICGNQTILLMKTASKSTADLIYTAWVDAGSPDPNAVQLTLTAFLEGYTNTLGTAMNYAPSAVTVELHGANSPYALIESKTGSLSTAGIGTFNFTTAVNGTPYYIVVKTWNTIETWSKTAQSFTSGSLSYDFTSAQTQAYGNNLTQIGTKWCIYSGDINQDGYINLSDYNLINNDSYNLVHGAVVTDLTGDLYTNLTDDNIVNNNSYIVILKHTPILGN
jgi:hypothetical protein